MEALDRSTYSYSRWKVPRGVSHPLKRGELDAQLTAVPRLDVSYVSFFRRPAQDADRYFDEAGWRGKRPVGPDDDWLALASASWHPPGDEFAFWRERSLSLTIYAVPSMRRAALHEIVLVHALPAVLAWGEAIATGPQTGLSVRRRCVAGTADDRLVFAECQAL